ncbi:nitroreductase family protein [Chloroflexota bacterium]
MEYDSLVELVKKRRSTRRFKSDPVSDEDISRIIEVAQWAPSGFNQQPWEFVVIRDKELKGKIVQMMREYNAQSAGLEACREPWMVEAKRSPYYHDPQDFANAPVFILLLGDTRTQVGLPMAVRYDTSRRESIFNSSQCNAFLYMTLAVASLRLACQWVSTSQVPHIHCQVKHLLGIPHYM